MNDDLIIDEMAKNSFNLGYRLAATKEGRTKAIELVKGKEDLPISQAITAGVKQYLMDDLSKGMNNIKNKKVDMSDK